MNFLPFSRNYGRIFSKRHQTNFHTLGFRFTEKRKAYSWKFLYTIGCVIGSVGVYSSAVLIASNYYEGHLTHVYENPEEYSLENWADVEPTLREGDIVLLMGTGKISHNITLAQLFYTFFNPAAARYSHIGVVVAPSTRDIGWDRLKLQETSLGISESRSSSHGSSIQHNRNPLVSSYSEYSPSDSDSLASPYFGDNLLISQNKPSFLEFVTRKWHEVSSSNSMTIPNEHKDRYSNSKVYHDFFYDIIQKVGRVCTAPFMKIIDAKRDENKLEATKLATLVILNLMHLGSTGNATDASFVGKDTTKSSLYSGDVTSFDAKRSSTESSSVENRYQPYLQSGDTPKGIDEGLLTGDPSLCSLSINLMSYKNKEKSSKPSLHSRFPSKERGALMLEAVDNDDSHVPGSDGIPRYNCVQIVEVGKRVSGVCHSRPCYKRFAIRRLKGFEWTLSRRQKLKEFIHLNLGKSLEKSPLLVLSFLHPSLYRLAKQSDLNEVSCAEVVASMYRHCGILQEQNPQLSNDILPDSERQKSAEAFHESRSMKATHEQDDGVSSNFDVKVKRGGEYLTKFFEDKYTENEKFYCSSTSPPVSIRYAPCHFAEGLDASSLQFTDGVSLGPEVLIKLPLSTNLV